MKIGPKTHTSNSTSSANFKKNRPFGAKLSPCYVPSMYYANILNEAIALWRQALHHYFYTFCQSVGPHVAVAQLPFLITKASTRPQRHISNTRSCHLNYSQPNFGKKWISMNVDFSSIWNPQSVFFIFVTKWTREIISTLFSNILATAIISFLYNE